MAQINTDEAMCSMCGKVHPRNELEMSFRRPDVVAAFPEEQRKTDVKESDDLCVIKWERFFVRAVLPLLVKEWDGPYRIGVWVEVEKNAFDRIRDLWKDPAQGKAPPFLARIANEIPLLPHTNELPVLLQLTSPTDRADVIVPESEHPLHREQRLGITAHRANEYSRYFS